MSRKRRALLTIFCLLALLLAVPVVLTWREVRQERLNRDLIAAVDRDETAAVRSLLQQGADPNAPVLPNDTRSFWPRLWDILRHKPLPRPPIYSSALLEAIDHVNNDNIDIVQLLLDAGADVSIRDQHRRTPLIEAAGWGQWRTVQALLGYHADVNAVDSAGNTALMLAAAYQDVKTVETLLNRGAEVNARNEDGTTALMFALLHWQDRQVERETVECLLRHGASVQGKDKTEVTVFALARVSGDKQLIQMLKQAGAK